MMVHIFELMKRIAMQWTLWSETLHQLVTHLSMHVITVTVCHDPCPPPLTSLLCSSRFLPRKTLVAMTPKAHTSNENETVDDV